MVFQKKIPFFTIQIEWNEMLRYMFDGGCWSVCTNCDEELFLTFFTDNVLLTRGGCDRSAGDVYSSMALISPLDFIGPCCPMLTEFVCVSWTFLTIFTLVSLILVYLGNFVIIYWRPFCNLHIWGLKNQNTDGQTPYLDLGHIFTYKWLICPP